MSDTILRDKDLQDRWAWWKPPVSGLNKGNENSAE